MPFQGFPKQTSKFLANLAKNNNRDWFTEHKQDYRDHVEAPAAHYLDDLITALSDLIDRPLEGKIFRIYRDIRFSKDKTPYNTHIRIAIFPTQVAKGSCGIKPAFMLSVEPKHLIIGAGSRDFPGKVLDAYRQAVDDPKRGPALDKLIAKYKKDDYRIDEPELKKVPRGFDPDHPRADLLRQKSLSVWNETKHPPELFTPKAIPHILKTYKKLLPIHAWLDQL